MSAKGNQFKSNTFKERGEENVAGKSTSTRKPKEKSEYLPNFDLQNGRAIKIVGLFFIVTSLYFLIAFTSYLFTWQDDQSYVIDANGGWHNFFKTADELRESGVSSPIVQNWLGKFGALLSHQFIYEWFGIASFLFVLAFFIIGYRLLFKVKILSISKTLAYSFFFLLFISITLGFAHGFMGESPHYLEGEFGYWTNKLLTAQVGAAGVAGIIAFAGLSILIIAYNIDFKIPERKKEVYIDAETPDYVNDIREQANRQKVADSDTSSADTLTKPTNNQRLAQNVVLTPNRFEREEEETQIPAAVVLSPLAANLPIAPVVTVASSLPLTVEPPIEEPEKEPAFTIEKTEEEKKSDDLVEQFGNYDEKLDLAGYKYPTIDLLENYGTNKISVNAEELEANKNKIVETLNHYNIEIDKIKATIGPTVTLYEIIPAPGVRISKIKNLEDDIALSLAALGIRIIAPMPGKGTIGIEVPNQHPEMVPMRSILNTEKWTQNTMDLPIALGKTISNEVYIADLAKMPHLLVAGATGQGKSVGINAILVSLLFKKHPAQLKFVLVDPKKVELTLFNRIERHFLAKLPGEADAIITDTKKVVNTLNSLCIEMDQRYDLLKDAQVRNLKEYNDKFIKRKLNPNNGHRFLPFIVLVVDEFADLMMTAGKEVEAPIARLAQLARAIGIHLVLATQRPSVNIITGTIKANFPARLAFRVLSKIDSRTILDSGGADQLIGRGDMLLSTGSDLIRLQCAFVDTPEVDRISEYIGNQRGYSDAYQLPEYVDEAGEGSKADFDPNERDKFFEDAARLIVLHQQGSTSLIQRKLKLGYNRAGRIIDQLEAAGIVGPFEGSKAREVLYPDEYSLEQFLNNMNKKD
ncbi:DNA translocase FtsK [Pedobacter changchengzhani]|uniref:DNA translocase FtsK n=1 Tax=Pedobacter changchengzhani TaxID=2529274 RepID=A0A4R5MMJ2_9SPHI|nr:DNA translocase FtsK [Pedobacter changchengzhani]TDG36961.1 DNA translocase FtsK [Pedobacter changchengzhani]